MGSDMLDGETITTTLVDEDVDDAFLQALESYSATSAATAVNHQQQQQPSPLPPPENANPRPEVIFLCGVDEMSTQDIQNYAAHVPLKKIEWINDTSCNVHDHQLVVVLERKTKELFFSGNLVFEDAETAKQAANSLLLVKEDSAVTLTTNTLLQAQPYKPKEHLKLQIRMATTADVKEKNARAKSRYYLLYGEEDRSNSKRPTTTRAGSGIENRLGPRRNNDTPPPRGDIFSRLGKRLADDHRRRWPRQHHHSEPRRRSLSPRRLRPRSSRERIESSSNGNSTPKELGELDIPESLKGRIGVRRPPPA